MVIGIFCFGAVLGWYFYYINRYRKGEVQVSDLVTVMGALGGGGVTALFGRDPAHLSTYGLGLAFGFFGYFLMLLVLVLLTRQQGNFGLEFFLDGRRRLPDGTWSSGGDQRPMDVPGR